MRVWVWGGFKRGDGMGMTVESAMGAARALQPRPVMGMTVERERREKDGEATRKGQVEAGSQGWRRRERGAGRPGGGWRRREACGIASS